MKLIAGLHAGCNMMRVLCDEVLCDIEALLVSWLSTHLHSGCSSAVRGSLGHEERGRSRRWRAVGGPQTSGDAALVEARQRILARAPEGTTPRSKDAPLSAWQSNRSLARTPGGLLGPHLCLPNCKFVQSFCLPCDMDPFHTLFNMVHLSNAAWSGYLQS